MSDYGVKDVAMMIAVSGAALGLAYSLSMMVTEILYSRLTLVTAFNVAAFALLFYVCTKSELLRIIYGWILIIETVVLGVMVAQSRKR